jgi:hypothetical protein
MGEQWHVEKNGVAVLSGTVYSCGYSIRKEGNDRCVHPNSPHRGNVALVCCCLRENWTRNGCAVGKDHQETHQLVPSWDLEATPYRRQRQRL